MNAVSSNLKTMPLIPLHASVMSNKSKADAYKTLLAIAIKEELPIQPINTKGLDRYQIYLQPLLLAKLNLIATQNNLSTQDAFAALTKAAHDKLLDRQYEAVGISKRLDSPFNTEGRPEQLLYYQQIKTALDLNKVVLAEASTGVGKSRSICASAIEVATQKKTPVVIAAPTLVVLGQLWSEMQYLRDKEKIGNGLKIAFYPGASEFVNEQKLTEFMTTHTEDSDVQKWIDTNGLMQDKQNPLKNAMVEMGVTPAYLMDDLRKLAINMPVEDFILRTEDECETNELLKSIRHIATNADIVFCTHTMLALSQRLKWTLVPEPAVLFIDEAHLFEQAVSSVHSDTMSLFSILINLRNHATSQTPVKSAQALMNYLRNIDVETDRLDLRNFQDKHILMEHLKNFSEVIKNKKYKNIPRIDFIRLVVQKTMQSIEGFSADSSYLSFSPDRRYPSISTGKSNIKMILGDMWKTAAGGVVLASATLYIKNQYGEDKSDYIADVLALPSSRLHYMAPITAPWVTAIPTIYAPSPDVAHLYAKPSNEADIPTWFQSIADKILDITNHAKGGTLVLLTSYDQILNIKNHLLQNENFDVQRLILHEKDIKVSITESKYRQLYQQGKRPIWIALGPSWTGLDLKTHDRPDHLLSDLIIGISPIGLNRTNTMLHRIQKGNFYPIVREALMMLKQGFGRSTRDPSQTDKNIWFLDGRVFQKWPGMEDFQRSVKKMIAQYKNVNYF